MASFRALTTSVRRTLLAGQRRHLAIQSTVKNVTDTSKIDFPAPSHVGVVGECMELTKEMSEIYTNPDLKIKLTEKDKEDHIRQVIAEVTSLPGCEFSEKEIRGMINLPDELRLGDNPYFKAFEKERKEKKAALEKQ